MINTTKSKNIKLKKYLLKHTKLDEKFIEDFFVVTYVDYKKTNPMISIATIAKYLDINKKKLYEMIEERFVYNKEYYNTINICGLGLVELCFVIDTKISNNLAKKYSKLYDASNKYYDKSGDKFYDGDAIYIAKFKSKLNVGICIFGITKNFNTDFWGDSFNNIPGDEQLGSIELIPVYNADSVGMAIRGLLYDNIYVYNDDDNVKHFICVSYNKFIETVKHILRYHGKNIKIIKKVFDNNKINDEGTNFFLIDIDDDYTYKVNDRHYITTKQKGGDKLVKHLFRHVNQCVNQCVKK